MIRRGLASAVWRGCVTLVRCGQRKCGGGAVVRGRGGTQRWVVARRRCVRARLAAKHRAQAVVTQGCIGLGAPLCHQAQWTLPGFGILGF